MTINSERNNLQAPLRILHTMIRVSDLERSIHFYKEILGMEVIERRIFDTERFTLVFVGYNNMCDSSTIELTYNWDINTYEKGTVFGHIAIEVDDIYKFCIKLSKLGIKLIRPPGPMKYANNLATNTETIAFIEDPDGNRIELIQSKFNGYFV